MLLCQAQLWCILEYIVWHSTQKLCIFMSKSSLYIFSSLIVLNQGKKKKSFSLQLKWIAQWSLQNIHHSNLLIFKECEWEMSKKKSIKNVVHFTAVWYYLCFSPDIFLWPHIISLSLLISSHPFFRLPLSFSKNSPCLFLLLILLSFLSLWPIPVPLLFSSTPQTLCLTGAPITMPRVHHHSISQ